MRDYKNMWEKLKKKVQSNIKYYQDGSMCSIAESIHGENQWRELKNIMDNLENEKTDKNCNYCRCNKDGYVKAIEKRGHLFIDADIKSGYIIYRCYGKSQRVPINFCPMCGRKFDDTMKGEE